jgi:hypothetical protein
MKTTDSRIWQNMILALIIMAYCMGGSSAIAQKLSIEPKEIVMGMPENEYAQTSQSLWAVYRAPKALHAEYLNTEVDWSSRDSSIATVDASGMITPIRPGKTWIIAKYAGHTAMARVNVIGSVREFHLIHSGRLCNYTAYVPNNISMPVPIMMFHGTTDLNYPIEGVDGSGKHGVPDTFYPVVHPTDPDTLSLWQNINDTRTCGTSYYHHNSAQCKRYAGVAPVVMCIIDPAEPVSEDDVAYDGGGHAWPRGVRTQRSQADTPSSDIDASEQMWHFFQDHSLQ